MTWWVNLISSLFKFSKSSYVKNSPPKLSIKYYKEYIGTSLFNKKIHFEKSFLYFFNSSYFFINF
jgi:hypothetical protein